MMTYEETNFDIFCKTKSDEEIHADMIAGGEHDFHVFSRDMYDRSDFVAAKYTVEKFIKNISTSDDSNLLINVYETEPTYASTIFCQVMDTNKINYIRHISNLGVREVTLSTINTPGDEINTIFRSIPEINSKSYIDPALIDITDEADYPLKVYIIIATNQVSRVTHSMLIKMLDDAKSIYSDAVEVMLNETDEYDIVLLEFALYSESNAYGPSKLIGAASNKEDSDNDKKE